MDQGATQLLGRHLLVCGGEAGDPPGLCAGSGLYSGSLYLTLKGMPYPHLQMGKLGFQLALQGGPSPLCSLPQPSHLQLLC